MNRTSHGSRNFRGGSGKTRAEGRRDGGQRFRVRLDGGRTGGNGGSRNRGAFGRRRLHPTVPVEEGVRLKQPTYESLWENDTQRDVTAVFRKYVYWYTETTI